MKQILKGFTIEVMRLFTMIVYPDVWKLYEKVHGMGKKNGFIHNLLLETYEKRLFVGGGSWIGRGASFKGKPYFPHGISGIFISSEAVIGTNCIVFHQVTIGSNRLKDNPHFGSPIVGDNVYIGSGAKLIGKIVVGNNVRIGANAVVTKDVPSNCVVVGNNRIIQKDKLMNNRFYYCSNDGIWRYYDNGRFVIDKDM